MIEKWKNLTPAVCKLRSSTFGFRPAATKSASDSRNSSVDPLATTTRKRGNSEGDAAVRIFFFFFYHGKDESNESNESQK